MHSLKIAWIWTLSLKSVQEEEEKELEVGRKFSKVKVVLDLQRFDLDWRLGLSLAVEHRKIEIELEVKMELEVELESRKSTERRRMGEKRRSLIREIRVASKRSLIIEQQRCFLILIPVINSMFFTP